MTSAILVLIPTTAMALLFVMVLRKAANNDKENAEWLLALGGANRQRLPSPETLKCLFSLDDLQFVAGEDSKQLLALFVQQRRAIALSWLRLLRTEMLSAVSIHRRAARTSPNIWLRTEISLALRLADFTVMQSMLSLALRFYGPFAAKQLPLQLQRMSDRLSALQTEIIGQAPALAAA